MGQANTSAIALGIQTLLQGLGLYTLVKVGAVQDPTDVTTYAAITLQERKTERFDAGWKVNSTATIQIETGVEMTDSTVAELAMLNIADELTSLFVSRISLNAVPGVYVTLVDMNDRASYKVYPNGRIYRVHFTFVKAVQQYNVTVTQ